jgi:hypothetical protein
MERPVRFLLTLLALLTGLSAAPAQARVSAVDSAGIEQVEAGQRASVALAASTAIAQAGRRLGRFPDPGARMRLPDTGVITPTVEDSDRALE